MLALRPRIIFFFNDTATTDIYTLSLHDALPISPKARVCRPVHRPSAASRSGEKKSWLAPVARRAVADPQAHLRSEEHTSELQSQSNLVCRLLLEKKKIK